MMNYTKKKRVVKHNRFISIIKACKLIRIRDKSFLGFNTMIYAVKISWAKFNRSLKHNKNIPFIITGIQYPGMEYKKKVNELYEESEV